MRKKFFYAAGLAVTAALTMIISFSYINDKMSAGAPNIGSFVQDVPRVPNITVDLGEDEPPAPNTEETVRINGNTKIVYEYIYPDGIPVRGEDSPYPFIGLTEKDVAEIYYGWDIAVFSPESVILRKQLAEGSERYIVGVSDGYVAVFYDTVKKADNIKEVTGSPVNALSPDEQIRLKEGVYVTGRDNLIKVLEDYCS